MKININFLYRNQRGFTLIEVLLAFVILTILIFSFLSLFPQASKTNERTDERFTGANLAKEVLVKIQKSEGITNLLTNLKNNPNSSLTLSKDNVQYASLNLAENIQKTDSQVTLITYENTYKINIMLRIDPNFIGSEELYQTHIMIQNRSEKKVSDIFGYVIYKLSGD
ncbi:prepilin-type N-terminal cleavage/methylation domain-containing protein [Bacillus sp. 03113]|uniref:type IV pilus modification PilV family protein n=1 Tax=Bacillus sp. 03113 TaxID=2578211 RepID=UPI0011439C63|nr:prepilin-type N-terminal cleavage/methylation domain-containing protein [Bacillus sp. 03113]